MVADRGPLPWPNLNDHCPKRGAGLTHTVDQTMGNGNVCLHCGHIVIMPPTFRTVEEALEPLRARALEGLLAWEMADFPPLIQGRLLVMRMLVGRGKIRGDTEPASYQWKGTRRILARGLD